MKFLFASDSWKGSLTNEQTGELLEKAAKEVFPGCVCEKMPVADGGEGTVDTVIRASGGGRISVEVHGPFMERHSAYYGRLDEKRAVLEMALASGYALVPQEKKNPLETTTYGTGELIRDALDRGFRDISIAIGGSATNDGGMGCMRALGVRFLDDAGEELQGVGRDLGRVAHIDISGLDVRVKDTKFTVMCDVKKSSLRTRRSDQYLRETEGRNAGNVRRTGAGDAALQGCDPPGVWRRSGSDGGFGRGRRIGRGAPHLFGSKAELRH